MEEQEYEPSWMIEFSEKGRTPIKSIRNKFYKGDIPQSTYNYDIYTPVVMVPMNKTSAFVLSWYKDGDNDGLMIHDLRVVEDQMVSSISFLLRGNQDNLKRFKFEMLRVSDTANCVGMGFFFRKLFYTGFNTIMCPKILKSKPNSSLRAGMMMVQSTIEKAQLDNGYKDGDNHG